MDSSIKIRKTEVKDLQLILDMIQELADYEQMSDGPKLNVETLIRDGNFNNDPSCIPIFHSFVAEKVSNSNETTVIGYTIAFFSYSLTLGKSYFIEDIYVKPEYRRLGVGDKLFGANARYALECNCKQLNLHVLNWNKVAINFYKKLNGVDLTEQNGIEFYRFTSAAMDAYLKSRAKH